MLPDYRPVKAELQAAVDEFIRRRVGVHLGVFNEIKHVTLKEGREKTRVVRPSGEVEDNPLRLRSVSIEFKKEEVGQIALPALLRRLDAAAEQMAGEMARDIYGSIKTAVDRVGNAVDAQGKGLTATLMLEAFAKIEIEFDRGGQPILPTLHIHPSLREALELATRTLTTDPELREQFRRLISEKREQWREREANRKLVG